MAIGGCGRHLEAIEMPGQIVSNKHRTATVNTPRFEISATWTPVPWAGKHGPIGFHIQIANLDQQAIAFDVGGVVLEDGFGRIRGAIPPEKLWRSFAQQPRVRVRRTRVVTHHYYGYSRSRYCGGYPGFGMHTSYGGWGWPSDYDPYYEQRRTHAFLSRLLESQTIQPHGLAAGFVVFDYAPDDDDELTLWIEPETTANQATTQPADHAHAVALRFEVH